MKYRIGLLLITLVLILFGCSDSDGADAGKSSSAKSTVESLPAPKPILTVEGEPLRASTAEGSGKFSKRNLETGFEGAGSILTYDIDGDGDVDIFGQGSTALFWWENDGSGGFTKHVIDSSASNSNFIRINDMAIADIDNSGTMDLLVIGPEAFAWWENDGRRQVRAPFDADSI